MKNTLVLTLILFSTIIGFAQNNNDEIEVLRDMAATERRALVSENLMLSDEESKLFWPIYDDYRAEVKKINTDKLTNIEKFANNYESMTDETANEIMNDYFTNDMAYNKLRHSYRSKFIKVLPAKLVLRYFQIENKIDVIIEFSMAAEIPLVIKE